MNFFKKKVAKQTPACVESDKAHADMRTKLGEAQKRFDEVLERLKKVEPRPKSLKLAR